MSRLRWVERRERQVALFQPETPSRVLRRIEDLDQQLLPDLPGLPLAADQTTFSEDYEDGDSTIASSPPRTSSTKTRLDQSTTTSSPYTSTPAPASSIDHTTTSTRYSRGDDTASTARPPPPPQLASLGKSLNRSQQRQNEIESSYDDTMSEIGKRGNEPSFGQDDEEDMILLSGASGGEESEREATGHELSELSVPQALVEETTVEEQTTREEAESSFEEERHPLDALGEMGSKQDARLDQPVESTQKEKPILPSTLSPLRERDTNSTTFASPELGRNYSPRHSQHSLQDSLLSDQTPSRNGDKTPTSSLTPTRLGTPTLDSPLHSLHQDSNPATPLVSQTDAARRANHLLTTLRSTAKPRFTRGTPHPLRSVQKQPSSSATSALPHDQDDQRSTTTSSSFASDHSSNDLTTFHPKANTSLPSGGTADVGGSAAIGGGSRFNGAKLNAYLHQLNTHLTEENQNLVKTLKKTTDDNEKLQYTIREMSVAGGVSVDVSGSSKWRKRTNSSNSGEDGEGDNSRVEELGIELEGLVDGQRKIRGLQDRFGGELGRGKDAATKIRELEEELERAREQLGNKDDEIHQLREQVVSSKTASSSNGGGRDESSANLVSDLQQEVFDLKDALDTASSERDTAQADLAKLETDFTAAGQASEKDFANLQARIEELLEDLQEKDVEVDAVKQLLVDQETEFAEKMEELEKELSKVMEEQEKKVEAARDELDLKSREDEMARKGDKEALERIKAERDALEQRLEKEGKALDEALEEEILSLKRGIETRDEELNRMQEELEAAEGTGGDVEELRRQIKAKDEEIQQLEGALDESASQLLQNEDDLAALRQQLASEKQVNSSLSAQISQFSVVKARSPLGNEVFNSDKDDDIASLEEELEEARQEIVQLHEKLASNANEDRSAELRDLEIQNLETTKADLEDRVKSLRQQVSIQFSPSQTPDKSWLLRPLPAVRTPKTPGQFLSNLSNWSPGSAANETISPLLAQIHELEQMVEHLQTQLVAANAQIDNKLDRLEAAGFDTISIARQLSTAQTRIAELEGQLERLLGENGSIERVRARLTKVKCPDCTTTFDANKVVQLRVDQGGISFEGFTTQGKAVDSLRSDLALAHAKLDELRIEANVLRSQAARSKELSGDKSTLLAQQDALSKDLQQARNEIVVLETDLRTERSRLRTLTSDHAVSEKAKAALESRITGLETELRKTARTAAGSSPEVDSLRSALATKEAEQRRLQDERGDILRGVANLQADMNRVRQEAVSLGLDLAGVRRERDEFAKKQAGEKILQTLESKSLEELRARHKQESKGLLVLVRQLKLRVNREVQFRYLAGEQKDYLSSVVREKQATIDSIMSQLNLPLPSQQASRPTLRSAALAVCALSRMRRLSQQWKEDSVPKKRLREQAYPEVRGKPFPS